MMKFLSIALAATLSIAAPAQAATIVDTGTPTGNYIPVNPDQSVAGRFSLASRTMLTDVQGYIGGGVSDFTIAISKGSLPGTALYSGTFTSVKINSFQGLVGLSWILDAGDYWVSFASSGYAGMKEGAPRPMSQTAYTDPRWGWGSYPMSMGVRMSGVAAAVPEPRAWAMMIVGLGMIGAATRYRRRTVAVAC